MLFILCFCLTTTNAKADPNMDGGGSGGGTVNGTSSNFYNSGDDGVRLTVIDVITNRRAEGTITIDYSKKDKSGKSVLHFGKYCKLEYMGTGGYSIAKSLEQSSEAYVKNINNKGVSFFDPGLPIIVSSSNGDSDIEEIKSYFINETQLKGIATRVGMTYEELINGNYKLIIEPVIYLTFDSKYMAMTAHEATKLDMALGGTATSGGNLRAKFVSFTHKNLSLAIFQIVKE